MWHKAFDGQKETEKCKYRLTSFCMGKGLDIGCKDVKINPNALAVGATEICNVKVNLHDIDALACLGNNYFDYIFSSHYLEEFSAPDRVLAEWWSKVRPGGYMLLYCDDPEYTPKVGTKLCRIEKQSDLSWQDVWSMFERFGNAEKISASRHNEYNEYSWQLIIRKKCDFLQTPVERIKKTRDWGRIAFPRKKKTDKEALVIRYGAFGDAIWATPILRELKKQGYYVVYNTSEVPAQVIRENPNVDEFLIQEGDIIPIEEVEEYWDYIGQSFDKVINLCGVVEDKLLRVEGRTGYSWSHEKRHRRCNKNYIDALMETAGFDKKGELPELFFTPEEEIAAQTYMQSLKDKFVILWSLSGSALHKICPWAEEIALTLTSLHKDIEIITVGDDVCRIMEWQAPQTQNKSGQFTIRQSLLLTKYVDLVIGPETCVLNAASCYDTPKIIFLSHSSEENLTKYWKNCISLHPDNCPCHPCHKLHRTQDCPLGNIKGKVAKCTENLSPQKILGSIKKVYYDWKVNKPKKKWVGFTIADNELSHRLAKRVECSFRHYHPDIPFYIYDPKDEKELLGEVLDPGPYRAGVSMRPRVCEMLLEDYDGVIYLDVDTVVAARLDEFLRSDYDVAASLNVKGFGREALFNDGVFALTSRDFARRWAEHVYNKFVGCANDQLTFNFLTNTGVYDVKVVDEKDVYYNERSREFWGKIAVKDNKLFCNNRQLKVLHWAGGFDALEDKISCAGFGNDVRKFLNKVTSTTDFTDVTGKKTWWPTTTPTKPFSLTVRGLKVTMRPPLYGRQPSDADVVNEVMVRDEYRLAQLNRIIEPKVILDIGGHIGTFGLMAKKLWPDALLIAVEAHKESCGIYRRNMIDNGFDKYHILNYGLTYDRNQTCLAEDFNITGGGILTTLEGIRDVFDYSRGARTTEYKSVPTVTVEEIIKRFNLKSIDLAKWDIEGGELECFDRMSDGAATKFKYMIGEFHVPNKETGDYKSSSVQKAEFWEVAKDKFPHLQFNHYAAIIDINFIKKTYSRHGIGIFEAIPRGGRPGQTREDFFC